MANLSDLSNDDIALGVKPPTPVAVPDLGSIYKTASEVKSNLAYAQNAQVEAQRHQYDLYSDQLARAAQDVMQQPDGQAKTDRWNHYVDDFYDKGYLNRFDRDRYKDNPSDLILHQAIAHATQPETYEHMTGQTAAAEGEAHAPFDFHQIDPDNPAIYPAIRPGGPLAGQTRPSYLWPANGHPAPSAAPSVGSPAGAATTVPGATPGASSGPAMLSKPVTQAQASKDSQDVFKNDPYYKEAPSVPVGQSMPSGPGVVNTGVNPAAAKARDAGMKEFQDDISPAVEGATKTQASLGSMKSELQSGKVSTSRLAEIKQTIGGYVYGMLQGTEGADKAAAVAQKITGADLPWSEVFAKDSTRMGLTFARQTEGAREAVQAIRIALGANPSLLNSSQGNLKIIDLMNRGADYDIERGKAAQSYMLKQQDTTGVPHLTGFDNWFDNSHSPSQFTSKAVPYQLPRLRSGGVNDTEMKNGVTYDLPNGKQGVWDADQRHFMPVRQ